MSLKGILTVACVLIGVIAASPPRAAYFDAQSQIIGGEVVDKSITYQVSLRLQKTVGSLHPSSLSHFCGGSLIYPKFVITAAHCFDGQYSEFARRGRIYVVGGTTLLNFKPDSKLFLSAVESFLRHPKYNDTPFANDIAVLKLKTPAPSDNNGRISTIKLGQSRPSHGEKCSISGWGTIKYDDDNEDILPSEFLRSATVPAVDHKTCQERYKAIGVEVISNDMICAGYEEGGVDSCQGDSGGPLVCENGPHPELTGVVSGGYKCAEKKIPGLYASVAFQSNWIKEAIRTLNEPGTPKMMPENGYSSASRNGSFPVYQLFVLSFFIYYKVSNVMYRS